MSILPAQNATSDSYSRRLPLNRLALDHRFQPRKRSDGLLYDPERVRAMGEFDQNKYVQIEAWQNPDDLDAEKLPILSGFHRYVRAQWSGIESLDVTIRQVPLEEALHIAYRSNTRERPLTPYEEIWVIKAMADRGLSWQQIASELDQRSPAFYERRAAICNTSAGVLRAFEDGSLSEEHAQVIAEAAGKGASQVFQDWLRDQAVNLKPRIEIFRALTRRLIGAAAQASATSGQTMLIDLPPDAETLAGVRALKRAEDDLRLRDYWKRIVTAGQWISKHAGAPITLTDAIVLARETVNSINQSLGLEDEGSASEIIAEADKAVACPIVAKPIIKWAGGKSDSLPVILPHVREALAKGTGRLVEVFAGGAALTLAIAPKAGLLTDQIPDLVGLYSQIKKNPEGVSTSLFTRVGICPSTCLCGDSNEKHFYYIRDQFPWNNEADFAARLIYLNRNCYNGLYRTNKSGKYNVPWGKRKSVKYPTLADLIAVQSALANVEVKQQDWRLTLIGVEPDDVVYCDPPYEGTYDGYGPKWSDEDFNELALSLRGLSKEAFVFISQPDTPKARSRYESWCDVVSIGRPAGWKMDRRRKAESTGELLFIGRRP